MAFLHQVILQKMEVKHSTSFKKTHLFFSLFLDGNGQQMAMCLNGQFIHQPIHLRVETSQAFKDAQAYDLSDK